MKILIAEDDHDTATQYMLMLESRNHHVVVVNDGEACLKAYYDAWRRMEAETDNESPFDVIILDYAMPKSNGMEVAKAIFGLNPQQRIIFASAYAKETLVDSVKQLNRIVELLQKPFSLQSLVNTIEDKEIYSKLTRINAKLRKLKDLNPKTIQESLSFADELRNLFEKDLLDDLKKSQKPDVWYAIGDIIFA